MRTKFFQKINVALSFRIDATPSCSISFLFCAVCLPYTLMMYQNVKLIEQRINAIAMELITN